MINYDPFWNNVELLLKMNGTDASTTFIDLSNNALIVTPAGNAQVDISKKKFGTGSLLLDGNDYISVPSDATLNFGTDDFTLEMWIYRNATVNDDRSIVASGTAAYGAGSTFLSVNADGSLAFGAHPTGQILASTSNLPSATWAHLAIVRSGDNFTFFIDGVAAGTTTSTDTIDFSTDGTLIGSRLFAAGDGGFEGHLDDVRFTRVARYTADFAPSTETFYDSNIIGDPHFDKVTYLLQGGDVNGSTTLQDRSSAKRTFTSFGAVVDTSTSKFGDSCISIPDDTYYIAGDGDAQYAFGTEDFTIEWWMWMDTVEDGILYDERGSSGDGAYITIDMSSTQMRFFTSSSYVPESYADHGMQAQQWYHFALTRQGLDYKWFIDGVNIGGWTAPTLDDWSSMGTGAPRIAGTGSIYGHHGYLDDIRITRGVARYTETFSVPTEPFIAAQAMESALFDPSFDNVELLLHMDSDLSNSSNGLSTFIYGADAQNDATIFKFGSGSTKFDGVGDSIRADVNTDLTLSTNNFTIEGWAKSNNTNKFNLIDFRPDGGNGIYPTVNIDSTHMEYYANSVTRLNVTHNIDITQWFHWSVVRDSTSMRLYVNGVQIGSWVDTLDYGLPANRPIMGISGNSLSTLPLDGYMDEVRITVGVARYTTDFIVATSAFAETSTEPVVGLSTDVIKQSIDVILRPDTYIGPEVRVIKQSMDIIIRPIILDSSRRINYAYIVRGRR